ncbi:MAG TPA: hypothetical protein VIU29_06615 [Candidatus Deferrimicrobiaceae bacterium]
MSQAPSESLPVSDVKRFTRRRVAIVLFGILLFAVLVLVRFNVRGRFGGLFLLEGRGWRLLEVRDDLYLGEAHRLIAGVDFGPLRRRLYAKLYSGNTRPTLELSWDEADGKGYVISDFGDGRRLVTNFSRFAEEDGKVERGLFVGGGLPEAVMDDNLAKLTETGMAYFNGRRWLHIWCSSNEAISAGGATAALSTPSDWRFLGSEIIQNGPRRVVLSSSHEVVLEGVPLRIDRFAYFRVGEPYFRLGIRIRNEGDRTVSVDYQYGDEPWLGDFGSSAGNVGWTKAGIVERVGQIDTVSNRYAGMFDCGNSLVGPRHDFTNAANFIEWLGGNVPSFAYFGNDSRYDEADTASGAPLASNTRFLGLQWGPAILEPGEETTIYLAVGMASVDAKTGRPVKPDVPLLSPLDE